MTGIELKEAKEELEFVIDRFYDFPEETGVSNDINNVQNAIKAINELEDYYAIGTVEECREAMERQRAKKVNNRTLLRDLNGSPYSIRGDCPDCGSVNLVSTNTDYCNACGQRLDWSDTD